MAEYLPVSWRSAVEHHAGFLLSKILTRDLSLVRTHSFLDAELSSRKRSYPVVLLRAGLAAQTVAYTSIAEDLASHGYVVVGFDAPYRTMVVVLPDGAMVERTPENDADRYSGQEQAQVAMRLVTAWSADLSSAVDQLERLNASDPTHRLQGRLDL
jgi:predicted dienelactone hydrolase